MNQSYLTGKEVRLRAVEPEDLEVLYTMENDPEMWDISNFNVPYSKYLIRQFIEHSQADMYADQQLRLMIEHIATGEVVGTIDIDQFVPMHARGDVGISLRAPFRGKGYGKEALRLLCHYVFDFLSLKQLTAHVLTDNEASLALFRSCGFEPCGLLRQWWRVGGEYKDVVVMQCIGR